MRPLSFNGKALTRTVDNYWYTGDVLMWMPNTFNNTPSRFAGNYVWHDGNDTYYTDHGTTHKLDVSSKTWFQVDVGLSDYNFFGLNIWHDGNTTYLNIYDGYNTYVYPFDSTTKKFGTRILQDYDYPVGDYVWTDGSNVYLSMNDGVPGDLADNMVWNRSTFKWEPKTWYFNPAMQNPLGLMGNAVWKYNGHIYEGDWDNDGNFIRLYQLNTSTSTWVDTQWDGYCAVEGYKIWLDYEGNMYYSNGDKQYYMDNSTGKWLPHGEWTMLAQPDGHYVWTDGREIYHNDNYVLKR